MKVFLHHIEVIHHLFPPMFSGDKRYVIVYNGELYNYRDMKADNGGKQMRDLWALPEPEGEQVVWSIPTPAKSEKTSGRHPTQKPLSLLERVIRAGSAPGQLVLDPFNGSGTTGVAAVSAGRRYVGLDVDDSYLDLTARRLRSSPTS